jgi:polyisoprenyl-phosphate glycosyltransferase
MPDTPPLLSIVVPAFNEADNLPTLIDRLRAVLQPYPDYEILIVNDGSTDGSTRLLRALSEADPRIRFLSFSRNFGHQMALRAGLEHALGQAVISMDADLQHPPELIPTLVDRWRTGFDVVYTVRQPDPSLSWFKRTSSRLFYRLLRAGSDLDLEDGAADFRLLDRKVVAVLKDFQENDLFLRGAISWVGFRQHRIVYEPAARFAGRTKYSFGKMLRLAVLGITSFSTRPLFISIGLGFVMSVVAGLYGLVVIYENLFTDKTVSGWSSLALLILGIGGVQFILIGIIGLYLGKTFEETKKRPRYIIADSSEVSQSAVVSPAGRWLSQPR